MCPVSSSCLSRTPFVSVVVPVFNDAARLRDLLGRLDQQSYPRDAFETLVIDNLSTDDTRSVIEARCRSGDGQVKALGFEGSRSSYGARNAGIRAATGEIFAFVDSDCMPRRDWLEAGISAIEDTGADLASGAISFVFSPSRTAAEIVDSVTSLQASVENVDKGEAPTANLFARRRVFEEIGLFPQDMVSGGDFLWTKRATTRGFRLVYAGNAVVEHPARSWIALLKKHFRVGTGQRALLAQRGLTGHRFWLDCLRALKPPLWSNLRRKLDGLSEEEIRRRAISLWLCRWMCRAAAVAGRLWELAGRTRRGTGEDHRV